MPPIGLFRFRGAFVSAVAVASLLPWVVSTQAPSRPPAAAAQTPAIDADDIGGVVNSDKGPEAGVWVVAETTDLPTRFARIVVTDDQGRYVVPDLPKANYQVWVRGYGLVDSKPVPGAGGQRLNLAATVAPSPKEASAIYPAAYWLSMMRVPTTGPIGQAELTRTIKTCMACHQIGDKATRELPVFLRDAKSHLDAWDQRVKFGPSGPGMSSQFASMGTQRSMLAEWTDRIAKGEVPEQTPSRPRGVERNLVVTTWDWGGPATFAHDEAAGDKRDPRINANGPIWGPSQFHDTLMWVDPLKHAAGEVKIPTTAPLSAGAPSPHFNNDVIWRASAEPRSGAVDEKGRVWVAARQRPSDAQPAFCREGSANRFAQYYPLNAGGKQVSVYDPKTARFTQIDTCFTADHNDISENGQIYFGQNNAVGWIDTKAVDKLTSVVTGAEAEAVQGWCPGVIDTDGDGTITPGWTEPTQPVDPKRDHRIQFGCYQPGVAPDGAVWCGPGGETDSRIVRVEFGRNAPQSCRAEVYQVPVHRDARGARGLDVDSNGVVWVNMTATDQFARFDRRKCKVLNGPNATGQHCPEGWSFHQIPGPPFSGPAAPGGGAVAALTGRGTGRTTDMMYLTTVDRHDVLGLNHGKDVPLTELANSDALLAYLPESDEMVTLRVPYPLGFFARSVHGRIDDPATGWKGRGLWSSFASYAAWHLEGGVGTKSKVVKFQMRPTPLGK